MMKYDPVLDKRLVDECRNEKKKYCCAQYRIF